MPASIIVWLRRDFRLEDNPALHAAAARAGGAVIPVYVHAPDEEAPWAPGGASRWWLHHTLAAFDGSLRAIGPGLVIRRGPSLPALVALARETGAAGVFWNRLYDPATLARDTAVKAGLRAEGLAAESHNAALLAEPWDVKNKSGAPFQVFTPFWKSVTASLSPPDPLPAPERLQPLPPNLATLAVDELRLLPRPDWAAGLRASWRPGEAGAHALLARFLAEALADYPADRDRPDIAGTSRLSPHLHFGEIGPRQVWHAARWAREASAGAAAKGAEKFLAEVGWREFAHHLLFHFPRTTHEPLRAEFAAFPWKRDDGALRAWQRGRTGYPIVDAGMRELWHTGFMHNRVRMIVASFLVKHLMLPWTTGAAWFWDTLVDADLANNTLGWQWTAGCGADAAPYFRVFNPILQGAKFDPDGAYVRRWVPEIARVPTEFLFRPWEAPAGVLHAAGVRPGSDYPALIVDHRTAREEALAAFSALKKRE